MDQQKHSSIDVEIRQGVTIIRFGIDITQSRNMANIESDMANAITDTDQPRVVINFANVEFFPSTGVGTIVAMRKQVIDKHGVLALAGMSELIHHMFRVSGLAKVMPIYNSVDEAVENIAASNE